VEGVTFGHLRLANRFIQIAPSRRVKDQAPRPFAMWRKFERFDRRRGTVQAWDGDLDPIRAGKTPNGVSFTDGWDREGDWLSLLRTVFHAL
jgi:hypothetical protein